MARLGELGCVVSLVNGGDVPMVEPGIKTQSQRYETASRRSHRMYMHGS